MDKSRLQRFVSAQDGVYEVAYREIEEGRKRSHWMWFIYPQMKGLGRSEMSEYYGIADVEEAEAYLVHPLLGTRLRDMSKLLLSLESNDTRAVFGFPDCMKLCSCMTLFDHISPNDVFAAVLDKFLEGKEIMQLPICLTFHGMRKGNFQPFADEFSDDLNKYKE